MLKFEQSIGQFQAAHKKTLYTIRAVINGIELHYMHFPTGDTNKFLFRTVDEAVNHAETIAEFIRQKTESGAK